MTRGAMIMSRAEEYAGQTWEHFIDVIVNRLRLHFIFHCSNIVVQFRFLLIFWDDAAHIYKQELVHLTNTQKLMMLFF